MEQPNVDGKQIYSCYYEKVIGTDCEHKCRVCGNIRNQNLKNGYANLIAHLKAKHADYVQITKEFISKSIRGPIDSFVIQPSEKAKSIYGWLEWIVEDNLPLSFCEKPTTRKKTNLAKITVKTLKKYANLLVEKVKKDIESKLKKAKRFGLVIDGWSLDSHHFNGVFSSHFDEDSDTVEEYLLACNTADDFDEDTEFAEGLDDDDKFYGFTAADWFDFLSDTVAEYGFVLTPENFKNVIDFIAGDNCSTNKKLAEDLGKYCLFFSRFFFPSLHFFHNTEYYNRRRSLWLFFSSSSPSGYGSSGRGREKKQSWSDHSNCRRFSSAHKQNRFTDGRFENT